MPSPNRRASGPQGPLPALGPTPGGGDVTFGLKPSERATDEICRCADAEIEKAIGYLGTAGKAHELSQVLGDEHDLVVLRRTLAVDPQKYGGHAALEALFARIDQRREALRRRAFVLAKELYSVPPKAFTSRLEGYAKVTSGAADSRTRLPRLNLGKHG